MGVSGGHDAGCGLMLRSGLLNLCSDEATGMDR